MSATLLFCSFEVGGMPYMMARLLNAHGHRTLYLSIDPFGRGHNSTAFHYGDVREEWDLSHTYSGLARAGKREVIAALREIRQRYGIEHCFATGSRAHLLARADIPYHYWCYGSDLDQLCSLRPWPWGDPPGKRLLKYPLFLLRKRPEAVASIRQARSVMIAPYQQKALSRIRPGGELFFLPHIVPTASKETTLAEKKINRACLQERYAAEHILFSSSRHVWSNRSTIADNKGNDVILHAMAALRKRGTIPSLRVVLVEKGEDVERTRALARTLGLGNMIAWVGEMKREDLLRYYAGASVCLGQFATPVLTYVALEPLALATPAISYYGEGNVAPFYADPPPVLNTRDPDAIAGHLHSLLSDEAALYQSGLAAWQWAHDNCSEQRFAALFKALFSPADTPSGIPPATS